MHRVINSLMEEYEAADWYNQRMFACKDTDQDRQLEADLVLYAPGRSPNSAGLGLEALAVELDAKRGIKLNKGYQTNIPSLYALDDVTDRLNLTPVATAEAMALVDHRNPPTVAEEYVTMRKRVE